MQVIEERPWGKFEILHDGEDCKLKRITVNPGGVLSLQYHHSRDEFWRITGGVATVTFDQEVISLKEGDFIEIPREVVHRVSNQTKDPLVFIELQTGDYFGEDDIVRLEDNYGRK
jgi:mannose-6-phosphate isomerase-like protein (cupin superfamily)